MTFLPANSGLTIFVLTGIFIFTDSTHKEALICMERQLSSSDPYLKLSAANFFEVDAVLFSNIVAGFAGYIIIMYQMR